MKNFDITILTAKRYLDPPDPDWYVKQILLEDQLLREACERKGLRTHRIDWTNTEFDWNTTRAVIFRSTWDYTERYEDFLTFVKIISTQTVLINPASIILWNLDKHYLRDLSDRGIRIPETHYIERGDPVTLRQFHSCHPFDEMILKPAMSAGARHTYRLNRENFTEHEQIFRQLVDSETMMLQPFLRSVITHGEITLVVIGGRYSHAISKKAKQGDFRVQDDFGGTVEQYTPTGEEVDFAEKAVGVCDPLPAYARVDILRDNEGAMVVSELEMIEPELWFRFHPPAADKLADIILRT